MSLRKKSETDDEFESADEGESISTPMKRITISAPPVTDGWDNWNVVDDDETKNRGSIQTFHPTLNQQDSISSLSSSSPSKPESSSQLGSDEEEPLDLSEQQRLQRKKLRKKPFDINTRISRPLERRDDDSSSTSISQHDVKDTYHLFDRLAAQSPTRVPSWSKPWSNFGSFLSTAKQSVSTLTNTVSEGINAVIESVEAGLGAPDPQKLAEMDRIAFKIKGETSDSEEEPETTVLQVEKNDLITNQDGWLNALSLDNLTNTGMKVVSGSLDVLETVGKKTFEVINDADPDLQRTRRLLSKQARSSISDITPTQSYENEKKLNESLTFLQQFEKHHGLTHLESLEFLSNQSSMIVQTMSHGQEKLLEQIWSYFQLDDDDSTFSSSAITDDQEQEIPTLDALSQRFTAYQSQLRSTVSVDKLLEVYEAGHQCVQKWDSMDSEDDAQNFADDAIESLAILCATIVEYYRKTADLFLTGCKSLTSFSIDIELLSIYQKQHDDFSQMLTGLTNLFARHLKEISSTSDELKSNGKVKQNLLNQIFIQSSSGQTYASDAYLLLKPIVSQSILYHRSTLK